MNDLEYSGSLRGLFDKVNKEACRRWEEIVDSRLLLLVVLKEMPEEIKGFFDKFSIDHLEIVEKIEGGMIRSEHDRYKGYQGFSAEVKCIISSARDFAKRDGCTELQIDYLFHAMVNHPASKVRDLLKEFFNVDLVSEYMWWIGD